MQISYQDFEKIEKRVPRKYRKDMKEFYKVLNLALVHPVPQVAIRNNLTERVIYWWLQNIFKDRYKEMLDRPRVPLLNPKQSKREQLENTDQYFDRIEKEITSLQERCTGNMVVKCTLCGFIYGSETNLNREMVLGDLQDLHIKNHNRVLLNRKVLIEQTI